MTSSEFYVRRGKRVADILVSSGVGLVLCPVLGFAALAIRIDSRGPILFVQERVGKDGATFKLLKLRTMVDTPREVDREVVSGDAEVTRVGRLLRRFKLDEAPQVWNVLRGDMSIVGPRPCLPEQVETFNDDGRIRLQVRPGLTGLAQVNGNIYLSWPDRWKYDRRYVENQSVMLDLSIVAKTVLVLLRGEHRMVRFP